MRNVARVRTGGMLTAISIRGRRSRGNIVTIGITGTTGGTIEMTGL
jgi:hypothetical protein